MQWLCWKLVLIATISYQAVLGLEERRSSCTEGDREEAVIVQTALGREVHERNDKQALEMLQTVARLKNDQAMIEVHGGAGKQQNPSAHQIGSILADMKANLEARGGKAGGALVVMGNTGGDMDSVADAIAIATFLQVANFTNFLAHGKSSSVDDSHCGSSFGGINKSSLHYDGIFPVLNFPREAFKLRKDIQHVLLSVLEVSEQSLIFIDEIQVDDNTRFFLVDHNAINAAEFKDVRGKDRTGQVDFVVDHHGDQTDGKPEGNVNCYIKLVGSASSLVATLIAESTGTSDGANFFRENPQWSELLLSVEHQDWDPAKTKQYDKDIMVPLSQYALGSNYLVDLKRDVTGFTVQDFFLKDAKSGNKTGKAFTMPELPIQNLTSFVTGQDSRMSWSLQDFEEQVEAFMKKFNYAAVFLLKAPDQSPPPGEMALLTHDEDLADFFGDISHLQPEGGEWYGGQDPNLRKAASPFAGLKHLKQHYWIYDDANRKQMLPMVNDAMTAFAHLHSPLR